MHCCKNCQGSRYTVIRAQDIGTSTQAVAQNPVAWMQPGDTRCKVGQTPATSLLKAGQARVTVTSWQYRIPVWVSESMGEYCADVPWSKRAPRSYHPNGGLSRTCTFSSIWWHDTGHCCRGCDLYTGVQDKGGLSITLPPLWLRKTCLHRLKPSVHASALWRSAFAGPCSVGSIEKPHTQSRFSSQASSEWEEYSNNAWLGWIHLLFLFSVVWLQYGIN